MKHQGDKCFQVTSPVSGGQGGGFCSDSNNMITQLQHQHWTPWPAKTLTVSAPTASFICPPPPPHPKLEDRRIQNQHDFFQNITCLFWCRDSEMPGVVLRTLAAQSPSCWSAPVSCCESMPCALDSCTKTNLVDFHNYYNLIINPLVWTPHRTAWQRSHASCWEM